jgi:hypothetical protein
VSHQHWCEVTGHEWECEGTALRPLTGDTEPSICMCDTCHVPMEEGDHSGCMIELLACPEHMDEQLRAMQERFDNAEATEAQEDPLSRAPHCECGCADADPESVTGWCMWCDHVYVEYNRTTEDQHFAQYCQDAPQELKDSARARLAA